MLVLFHDYISANTTKYISTVFDAILIDSDSLDKKSLDCSSETFYKTEILKSYLSIKAVE